MGRSVPFLNVEDVATGTPMPALVAALRTAFAGRRTMAPARLSIDMGETAHLLVMPAWRGSDAIGVKVVEVDRAAVPAVRAAYLLIDRTTASPKALLEGSTLTRRRTAATSVLAASYLARRESTRLLLLGTGALIQPMIEAYSSQFALEEIEVWGRDPAKAEAAARAAWDSGYPARAARELGPALARTDIVSAATLSTVPLIRGADLRPGTHVDLVGAFRPDMREADGDAFACAQVFVDTREGALAEAGDLMAAVSEGRLRPADIKADIADLCDGSHSGRAGDGDAVTLFKSVGTAIADLAAAELAFTLNGPAA